MDEVAIVLFRTRFNLLENPTLSFERHAANLLCRTKIKGEVRILRNNDSDLFYSSQGACFIPSHKIPYSSNSYVLPPLDLPTVLHLDKNSLQSKLSSSFHFCLLPVCCSSIHLYPSFVDIQHRPFLRILSLMNSWRSRSPTVLVRHTCSINSRLMRRFQTLLFLNSSHIIRLQQSKLAPNPRGCCYSVLTLSSCSRCKAGTFDLLTVD